MAAIILSLASMFKDLCASERFRCPIGRARARVAPWCGRLGLTNPMATFSAHIASPPPPSRTPAGSSFASVYASPKPWAMRGS